MGRNWLTSVPPHLGYRPATSSVYYTSCKYSLVLLKMAEIIARNYVELIGIIKRPLLLHQVGCLYYLYQWCTVQRISKWQCNLQLQQNRKKITFFSVFAKSSFLFIGRRTFHGRIFKKPRSNHEILSIRMFTWSKFNTEDPQISEVPT